MPVATQQPSLTLKFGLMSQGIFPSRDGGDGASVGLGHFRIFGFDFVPSRGAAETGGQLVGIATNTALFSILSTTYGGDGRTTFGIPNLAGRVAVSSGQGPGLSFYDEGQITGFDTATLAQASLPVSRGGSSATIETTEESLVVNYVINPFGIFPSGGGALGMVGQISAFAGNFEPNGQLFCDGRLLAIAEYDTLFAVIGTTYGGDGQTTFALPDLRGRAPVGIGSGVQLGEVFGSETVSLTTANLPVAMGGSGTPVSNYGPSLGISYLIAIEGVFPSRDGGLTGFAGDEPMLGEILMFAGSVIPSGFVRAEGQLLSIAENSALFSLYGTNYGGDGISTFALPDLRGRAAVDDSPQTGQTVGQALGSASTTISINDFPALTLNGGAGIDTYYGANLADIINGNGGNDVLFGNGGADQIDGGTGADAMNGGEGDDRFAVDDVGDTVIGGGGVDLVNVSAASFTLADDTENLTYTGSGAFTGFGGATANSITGGTLNDVLKGRDGDDVLNGGDGVDTLAGGAGLDTLNGGEGNDNLTGGAGVDTLNGGGGDDTLVVEDSGDISNGGTGIDTVAVAAEISYTIGADVENATNTSGGTVTVTLNGLDNGYSGGAGIDIVNGGGGVDTMYGRGGNDQFNGELGNDRLYGEAGDDQLSGGSSSDLLYGGIDNDMLLGGADDDTLYGEAGNDTLNGGTGREFLYGGAGNDSFVFDDADSGSSMATADRIMDFASGDRIDLSAIDALTMDSSTPFAFIGTGGFTQAAGQLRYQFVGAETLVYGDTNGDGVADFIIRLQGNIALTAGDFSL